MDGLIYEHVGFECGTTPAGQELVGLLFPTGVGEECEARYMTLACVKALLIDLRDALAACEAHQRGHEPPSP